MKRILLGMVVVLGAGCFDFGGLVARCEDSGACAVSSGGGSAGGGSVGGGAPAGGGSASGGGSAAGGGSVSGVWLGRPDAGAILDRGNRVDFCLADGGWCVEHPFPHGFTLNTVWGSGPNDVWAAGAGGMLMRWNGVRWESWWGRVPHARWLDLDGRTANEVYLVGPRGDVATSTGSQVLRFDGTTWVSDRPGFSTVSNEWRGVSVGPTGDVVAVDADRSLAVKSAGASTWQRAVVDAGGLPRDAEPFALALGNSLTDCHVSFRDSASGEGAYVAPCTGGTATVLAPDGGSRPGRVWRSPTGEMWTSVQSPLSELWSLTTSRWLRRFTNAEMGRDFVAGAFPNGQHLVVGQNSSVWELGDSAALTDPTSVSKLNGQSNQKLLDVWAPLREQTLAVGTEGALVMRTPSGFEAVQTGGTGSLYGLAIYDGRVWAYGRDETLLEKTPEGWKTLRHRIGAEGYRHMWAGPNGALLGTTDGRIWELSADGGLQGPISTGSVSEIHGVWCHPSRGHCWASHDDGTLSFREGMGGTFRAMPVPSGLGVPWKIGGRGPIARVVSGNGRVHRLDADGGITLEYSTPNGESLYGVEELSDGTVLVVGEGAFTRHPSTFAWGPATFTVPGALSLFDAFEVVKDTVLLAGDRGTVAVWTGGTTAIRYETYFDDPNGGFIEAVRWLDGQLYAAGDHGLILRRPLPSLP